MKKPLKPAFVISIFCGSGGDARELDFARTFGALAKDANVKVVIRHSDGPVFRVLADSGVECNAIVLVESYRRIRYANVLSNVYCYPRADSEDFGYALARCNAAIVFAGGLEDFRNTIRYILCLNGEGPGRIAFVGFGAHAGLDLAMSEVQRAIPGVRVEMAADSSLAFNFLFQPATDYVSEQNIF